MTFLIAARSAVARCAIAAAFTLMATPLFAITIDGESRLTQEQFAKKNGKPLSEVQKTFAATGTLECVATHRRGRLIRRLTTRLTAQLTGKNDVIVTAAHGFVDIKTCEKKMRPSQCTFKARDGNRSLTREVELVAMGNVRCAAGLPKGDTDWAVLKLSSPIATIAPYELSEPRDIVTGARVLSVSAQSVDFYLDGRNNSNIKTIDDCSIKRSWRLNGTIAMLATDCDVAHGNSGGAMLVGFPSGPQRLLAIVMGGVTTSGGPKLRNKPQDGPYNERTWSTLAVPLAGEFRAALERALGRQPSVQRVVFPTPDLRTLASPTLANEKLAFPAVSAPCEQGADTEGCRKP